MIHFLFWVNLFFAAAGFACFYVTGSQLDFMVAWFNLYCVWDCAKTMQEMNRR